MLSHLNKHTGRKRAPSFIFNKRSRCHVSNFEGFPQADGIPKQKKRSWYHFRLPQANRFWRPYGAEGLSAPLRLQLVALRCTSSTAAAAGAPRAGAEGRGPARVFRRVTRSARRRVSCMVLPFRKNTKTSTASPSSTTIPRFCGVEVDS